MSDDKPPAVDVQAEQALAVVPKDKGAAIAIDAQGLAFENAAEVFRISEAFVRGGVAPKGATPGAVMAAMLKGRALGLDPVTSLANITVVNGRVTIGGALILGLVRKHHATAELSYRWEGEANTRTAIVRARRVDEREATEHTFSMADAVRAGLAGKDTYKAYGDDMLLWRAVARMGRRQFSDILAGCYVPGEVVDVVAGPTAEAPALAPPPAADPLLEEFSPAPPVDAPPDEQPDLAPAVSPEPFPSHGEADRAIAEAEQGGLFDEEARP